MANSLTHTLPMVVKNARFTLAIDFRIADGTPTDPTSPDTEYSTNGGLTYSDCAEEITTGGGNGMGYLTLTGAETNNTSLSISAKSSNCITTQLTITPKALPVISSGTASAGSSSSITLGTILAYDIIGCIVRTTGGTGGGGTGGANNQARVITAYNTTTGVATIEPNWETNPDGTTTYDILVTDMAVISVKSNLLAVNNSTVGVDGLSRAIKGITTGVIGSSSTVSNIVTSSLSPAAVVADQFKGLILAFTKDTTTTNLRGQKTDITASTYDGILTVTALTTAPVSGDTFVIE